MARRRSSATEVASQEKTCISTPTVYHAAVVVFLEFFAFGLLTTPMISVLDETFPKYALLMNGIIQGVKGFLSFFSAPLLGALSDALGRKPFLFLTVTFTCLPIPLMKISHWWYFTMISISGVFAVTFSVVLAYVADITSEEERSWGYGLVSATFAASLVTSPAIGAYLGRQFGEDLVVALATAIACLDVLFILACVPESLPEKVRTNQACSITGRGGGNGGGNCGKISWDKVDPFAALRKLTSDYLVLIVCITTFFSYLPEAGQYSCFFLYLRLVMGFSEESVALFIAVGGILSCISQTVGLNLLNTYAGPKRTIIIGLVLEATQLTLYGFATHPALLWIAGLIAAMGTLTYPALSAFVSKHAAVDQQGGAQGLVTGIRGLCGGLGPALFGLIFYIFRVDLNTHSLEANTITRRPGGIVYGESTNSQLPHELLILGAPFAFGAVLVLVAIFVAWFIPENPKTTITTLPLPTSSSDPPNGSKKVDFIVSNRLRRFSMLDPDTREFSVGCEADSNDLYGSESFLFDSKSRVKHSSMWTKDHLSDSEPKFWDRLVSGWSGSRTSASGRRANRIFRQPTVSFTRARFVEPIRRLFTGFSMGRSTMNGIDSQSPTVLSIPSTGFDLTAFEPCDMLRDEPPQYRSQSWYDAQAADLSNYRSHNLKQLLTTSSPSNCTDQRPDLLYHHHKPRGFTAGCPVNDAEERTALLTTIFDQETNENFGDSIGSRVSYSNPTAADH